MHMRFLSRLYFHVSYVHTNNLLVDVRERGSYSFILGEVSISSSSNFLDGMFFKFTLNILYTEITDVYSYYMCFLRPSFNLFPLPPFVIQNFHTSS